MFLDKLIMVDILEIENLSVEVEGKIVVKDLSLKVKSDEIHAIMGPNGSGKSSLSLALMGHPKYKVVKGDIRINGESILGLTPDKRAKKGLFVSMQYPISIPGVNLITFIKASLTSLSDNKEIISLVKLKQDLAKRLKMIGLNESFISRYVNEGFSGGEKKRSEIVQMSVIKPKFAILDEIDSGLDIDSIKTVAEYIIESTKRNTGLILITHYNRILKFITPDFVHVLIDGRIVESGGPELADHLEEKGYNWLLSDNS